MKQNLDMKNGTGPDFLAFRGNLPQAQALIWLLRYIAGLSGGYPC